MMKKFRKALIWAMTLAAALCVAVNTAWADSFTMADISMMEYRSGAAGESNGGGVKYNDWYEEQQFGGQGSSAGDKWDAAFVCWCADQLGYIKRNCFPMTNDTAQMLQWFTGNGYQMYTLSDCLEYGDSAVRAGDVIFVSTGEDENTLCVGIVTHADSAQIEYVMGNVEGAVQLKVIEPTQRGENIAFFPVIPSESDNYFEIVQFLEEKMNLNPAGVCGIIANILYESDGMPTALGDNGTSYGICQWHEERWQQLINYCNDAGYDWRSLDGQLMFLWYDLNTQFPDLKNMLVSCPDSADGAYKAGYAFCLSYESPQDSSTKAEIRAAESMYNVYPSLYS